jgi:hypothetical protein
MVLRIRTPLLAPTGTPAPKIFVKNAGVWKQAVVSVNVSGVWKQVTVSANVGGTWKLV